ncbi:Hypothetical protein A7982_02214 [Minicystis rosea]|nr:Hypothetical protein A7982_02214 [Minicystis rosea]
MGVAAGSLFSAEAAAQTAHAPSRVDPAVEFSARARGAYEKGDFRAAVELYKKAHDLRADPTLLFNLARCYEALATLPDLKEAIVYYEAYLRERGSSSDRAAVERRVEVLRQQIHLLEEQSKPKAAPVVAPVASGPPTPPPPPKRTPVPWIITGIGAGGVVVGGVLGVLAKAKRADAVAEPSSTLASDLESKGRSFATGANVAFIAGGSLMLAGTTWGIVTLATSPKAPSPVDVNVGLGTLQLSGRF